jgi:hypothetical protein
MTVSFSRRILLHGIGSLVSYSGWEGVDWIHLAQDRDQWRVSFEHGNETSGPIKGGKFLN